MSHSAPATPARPSTSMAAPSPYKPTPSRSKIARWEQMLRSDPLRQQRLEQIHDKVRAIVDPELTDADSAELALLLIFDTCSEYMSEIGLSAEILPNKPRSTRLGRSLEESVKDITDLVEQSTLKTTDDEPDDPGDHSTHNDDDDDDDDDDNDGEFSASLKKGIKAKRRVDRRKRAATQTLDNQDSVIRDGLTKETATLIGTEGTPRVTRTTIDLSDTVNRQDFRARQVELSINLFQHTPKRTVAGVNQYVNLRPTVVNALVEFFTTKILGMPGILRLNTIIAEFTNPEFSAGTAQRARMSAYDPDRNPLDKSIRLALAEHYEYSASRSSTYRDFRATNSEYKLALAFDEAVQYLRETNDETPRRGRRNVDDRWGLRLKLGDLGFEPSQGRSWDTVLREYYCHPQHGIPCDPKVLNRILRDSRPIRRICDRFGGPGITLLLPANASRSLSHWTTLMLDEVLTQLDSHFPELGTIGKYLTLNVYDVMMSDNFSALEGIKVATKAGAGSFCQRLEDAFNDRIFKDIDTIMSD